MIIQKRSREAWLKNLPEEDEAREQVIKDLLFELFSETIAATLQHYIYFPEKQCSDMIPLEEIKKNKDLVTLYIAFPSPASIFGECVVTLVN